MIEYHAHDESGRAIRMELIGRLDSAAVEQIEAPVTATIRSAAVPVLVDVSHVTFIGSLGIRMLVSVGRVLQRQGRKIVIFGAQSLVADVFESVTLGDLIPVVDTQGEAIDAALAAS